MFGLAAISGRPEAEEITSGKRENGQGHDLSWVLETPQKGNHLCLDMV